MLLHPETARRWISIYFHCFISPNFTTVESEQPYSLFNWKTIPDFRRRLYKMFVVEKKIISYPFSLVELVLSSHSQLLIVRNTICWNHKDLVTFSGGQKILKQSSENWKGLKILLMVGKGSNGQVLSFKTMDRIAESTKQREMNNLMTAPDFECWINLMKEATILKSKFTTFALGPWSPSEVWNGTFRFRKKNEKNRKNFISYH